jgi:hypothetical protein
VLQNDISCGVPEAQVLALRYLPHLPPEHLLHLLDKGEGGARGSGSSSSSIITWKDYACMCIAAAAPAKQG